MFYEDGSRVMLRHVASLANGESCVVVDVADYGANLPRLKAAALNSRPGAALVLTGDGALNWLPFAKQDLSRENRRHEMLTCAVELPRRAG